MKYIRFQNIGLVLFEDIKTHASIARIIGDIVQSAGFVSQDDAGNVHCGGCSVSLNVASNSENDTQRLRSFLKL